MRVRKKDAVLPVLKLVGLFPLSKSSSRAGIGKLIVKQSEIRPSPF